ncbi:hypothetical protein [Streptomyces sp. NPDC049915]|uniref:hypothetical protein n=1 Tax=Streptomyces sp. NPDC049915 TaxID=3155510 RepID=UPI00341436A7
MTASDLIVELSAVPERCWIVSSYPDQSGAVEWLPLVQISVTGIWLGLDRRAVWTLGRIEGAVESSAENIPSSWVTILDGDEKSFRVALNAAAERLGLSSKKLQKLIPVEEILTMAIRSRSSHWVERAVHWMSERHISGEHLQLLQELSTAKWANQRTRHMARRLVKASEK